MKLDSQSKWQMLSCDCDICTLLFCGFLASPWFGGWVSWLRIGRTEMCNSDTDKKVQNRSPLFRLGREKQARINRRERQGMGSGWQQAGRRTTPRKRKRRKAKSKNKQEVKTGKNWCLKATFRMSNIQSECSRIVYIPASKRGIRNRWVVGWGRIWGLKGRMDWSNSRAGGSVRIRNY